MFKIPAPLLISFKRVTAALRKRYRKNKRLLIVSGTCNAVTLLRVFSFVCAGAGVCISLFFSTVTALQRYKKDIFLFISIK